MIFGKVELSLFDVTIDKVTKTKQFALSPAGERPPVPVLTIPKLSSDLTCLEGHISAVCSRNRSQLVDFVLA